MSSFVRYVQPTRAAAWDPTKHVKYNMGMVLGEADFTQEFVYLSGHDHWLARDLVGYGTVRGLQLRVEGGGVDNGPQVVVGEGVALSPGGQLIRVRPDQCADLNSWLRARAGEVDERIGPQPIGVVPRLPVYVVLCYRECPTDLVPIPGEPCRSEEETRAHSRLKDDFRLELRFNPPEQEEENAIRDFVAWLSQLEVSTDTSDFFPTLDEFADRLRQDAVEPLSPPASPPDAHHVASPPLSPPDFMLGSPPANWRIPADLAYEYLRVAFRIWVTELRPRWAKQYQPELGCPDPLADGDCGGGSLLLAELTLPLVRMALTSGAAAWVVQDPAGIEVNEDDRPYLVHLRMLQEWLLSGRSYIEAAAAASPGPAPGPGPGPGPGPAPGPIGPHPHNLAGDARGPFDDNRVTGILNIPIDSPNPPGDGHLLSYVAGANRWRPLPLGGDVRGGVSGTRLEAIQGVPVGPTNPAADNGKVLRLVGGVWQPDAIPAPAGPAVGDFVEHPRGAGSYAIVAAGLMVSDGSSRGPVYNDLKVIGMQVAQGAGNNAGGVRVSLTFSGYEVPGDDFQYIVKVLPVFIEKLNGPIIGNFVRFLSPNAPDEAGNREGFVVLLSLPRGNIPESHVKVLEFMVEVSRYPF